MNVSHSNTRIKEAETLAVKLLWEKPITEHSKNSAEVEVTSEKPTDVKPLPRWNNINWKKTEAHVNRLQVRITKAVTKGNWNLAKRLSYLLTHSHYAKLLAVRKVIQNKGKRTAGIDGELWSTPKSKMNAALKLSDKRYKAKPLKRIFIDKYGSDKKRPLGIPTMYDRAMQALYALALDPIAEATADKRPFGFQYFTNS